MPKPNLSAGRTKFAGDPGRMLWTLMYWQNGQANPYSPAHTGMPLMEGRSALTEIRAKYPNTRFYLTETKADHITVAQSRKVLKGMFAQADRPDLVKVAGKARAADVRLLAGIAFDETAKAQRKLEHDRINEQRKMKGLKPLPGLPENHRPEPEITTRNGRVLIHLGTRV